MTHPSAVIPGPQPLGTTEHKWKEGAPSNKADDVLRIQNHNSPSSSGQIHPGRFKNGPIHQDIPCEVDPQLTFTPHADDVAEKMIKRQRIFYALSATG